MQFKKSLKINEILHITLAREEIYFFLLVLYFNILPLILHIEKKKVFLFLYIEKTSFFFDMSLHKKSNRQQNESTSQKDKQMRKKKSCIIHFTLTNINVDCGDCGE